jgi:hypothetical protein
VALRAHAQLAAQADGELGGRLVGAVEAGLLSSVPHGKRMLIINNGVYGERMASIVGVHRLGVSEFKLEWTTRPDGPGFGGRQPPRFGRFGPLGCTLVDSGTRLLPRLRPLSHGPFRSGCCNGWSSQAVDPTQDRGEQRWRRCHSSQLEHEMAAVAHASEQSSGGADLGQLLAQGRQRPLRCLVRQREAAQEVGQVRRPSLCFSPCMALSVSLALT